MWRAFTLIELLVVITIIVVLLSLLTPALDKAIYQAELAVCATHLDSIGSGVLTYTMEHKRRYPFRTGRENGSIEPDKLVNFGESENPSEDDRAILRPYLGINGAMNDPLSEDVDLDKTYNELQHHVYASYILWYGWQFTGPGAASAGMMKFGDRLGWTWDEDGVNGAETYRFDVLAQDADFQAPQGALEMGFAYGSHPDADGVLQNKVYDDEDVPDLIVYGARRALGLRGRSTNHSPAICAARST